MGGDGTKAIAFVAILLFVGMFYLWFTGGSLSFVGKPSFQQAAPIAPMSAEEGGFDFSSLIWPLVLLLLLGGGLGALSKLRGSSWAPWRKGEDILELTADPVEVVYDKDGRATSIISARLKDSTLVGRAVVFTIGFKSVEGTQAELVGLDFAGRGQELTASSSQAGAVKVRLNMMGTETTDVQVCAMVRMLFRRKPHACVIVTARPPSEAAKPLEAIRAEAAPAGAKPSEAPVPSGVAAKARRKRKSRGIPERYRTLIVTTHPAIGRRYFSVGAHIRIKALVKEKEGRREWLVAGQRITFTCHGGRLLGKQQVYTNYGGYAENAFAVGPGLNVVRIKCEGEVNNSPYTFEVWGGKAPEPKEARAKIEILNVSITNILVQVEKLPEKKDVARLKKQAEALARELEKPKADIELIYERIEELEKKLEASLNEGVVARSERIITKSSRIASEARNPIIKKELAALNDELQGLRLKELHVKYVREQILKIHKQVYLLTRAVPHVEPLAGGQQLLSSLEEYSKKIGESTKTETVLRVIILIEAFVERLERSLNTKLLPLPEHKEFHSPADNVRPFSSPLTPQKGGLALRAWAVCQSQKKRYVPVSGVLYEMPLKPLHEKVERTPVSGGRIELPAGENLTLRAVPEDAEGRSVYLVNGEAIKTRSRVRFVMESERLAKEDKGTFKHNDGGAFELKVRVRKGGTRYYITFVHGNHKLVSEIITVFGQ